MLLGLPLLLCYSIKQNGIGKNLIKINRYEPSTKTCSSCKTITELKLSDRKWTCPNCNIEHDRDINAAINIKNIGLKDVIPGMKCPVESVENKKSQSFSIKTDEVYSMKQKIIELIS